MLLSWLVLASKTFAQDDPAKVALLQGNQYYQAQNYVEAEKSLLSAIQLNANYPAAHQLLGNVYYAEGRKAEALAEYQKTLALQPDNASLKAFVDSQQSAMAAAPSAPATAAPTAAPTAMATAMPMTVETNSNLDKGHPIVGAYGGLALPISGFTSSAYVTYGLGGGGGIYAGAAFDRHFSVALKLADYNIPYTIAGYSYYYGFSKVTVAPVNDGIQQFEVMTSGRYAFLDSGVRPFVTIGMGAYIGLDTGLQEASTAPMFEGGLGVTVPLSPQWDVFAEFDYDVVLNVSGGYDYSVSYMPINIGTQFNP